MAHTSSTQRCRKLRNFDALCAIYSGLVFGFSEKLSHESLVGYMTLLNSNP